uniref:Uncharacterized protein n=1 Tax=Moniliophthora roreri TaxID=221103 RepID=A0A0W0G728_MONRR
MEHVFWTIEKLLEYIVTCKLED